MSEAERQEIERTRAYDIDTAESEDPDFFGALRHSDPSGSE